MVSEQQVTEVHVTLKRSLKTGCGTPSATFTTQGSSFGLLTENGKGPLRPPRPGFRSSYSARGRVDSETTGGSRTLICIILGYQEWVKKSIEKLDLYIENPG